MADKPDDVAGMFDRIETELTDEEARLYETLANRDKPKKPPLDPGIGRRPPTGRHPGGRTCKSVLTDPVSVAWIIIADYLHKKWSTE